MKLIRVDTIAQTAVEGVLDLMITADIGRGDEQMPFAFVPSDVAGLSSEVAAWLRENPDLPRTPFQPPAARWPTLTKRQIVRALIIGADAADPEAMVEAGIAAIEDPSARALALADWRHAPSYTRDHELFSDPVILAALSLTVGDIDELWALGAQQPS